MELVRPFDRIGKEDAAFAGGKGASLGEMTQAGIPVPPGFVLLAGAFEKFLDEANLNSEVDSILSSVDTEAMHTVDGASAKIQALILGAKMPTDIERAIRTEFAKLDTEYVAVRSSATAEDSASAAWAGQLDTYLNTTTDTLLENVQKCWASLFTPRAIFYRFEKGLHGTKISVAVVVQKMVASEASGIAFSVHPVTEDRNQLIIEAGFGLGEAIVSGQITPDSFVITKEPRAILDKNITFQERALWRAEQGGNEWRSLSREEGEKPALRDEQALALADIVCRIESHYGFPVDVEWAMEVENLYITQSRPITTLSKDPDFAESPATGGATSVFSEAISEEMLARIRKHRWYRHGIYRDEIFAISNWIGFLGDEYFQKQGISRGVHHLIKPGDAAFLDEDEMQTLKDIFADKVEEGGSAYLHSYTVGQTAAYENLLAVSKEMKELSFVDVPTVELKRYFERFTRAVQETAHWLWTLEFINPALDAYVRSAVRRWKPHWSDKHLEAFMETVSFPKKKLSFQREKEAILRASLEDEQDIQALFQEYTWLNMGPLNGHPFTYDEYKKRVRAMKQDPLLRRNTDDLEEGIKKAAETIAAVDIPPLKELLDIVRDLIFLKTNRIDIYGWSLSNAMNLFEEIAKRLSITYDQLLKLTREEITAALETERIPDDFDKREGYAYVLLDGKLHHFYGKARTAIESILYAEDFTHVRELRGTAGYKGFVRGTAKVLMTDRDLGKLKKGDIMVANLTNPNYDPAFGIVAGVVTDEGGLLCHSAIMSREFKIPCVIGTKIATRVIQDGDMVEVDADNGVVRILERRNSSSVDSVGNWKWRKDWEGDFSMLICDMSAPPYYHESLEKLGTNTDKILVLYREGVATCLLSKTGDEKFGKDLADIVKKNPALLEEWSNKVMRGYDALKPFMELPTEDLMREENLTEFVRIMRTYCTYLGAIKTVANFLPSEILEKEGKAIFEARTYTEPFFFDSRKTCEAIASYINRETGYDAQLLTALLTDELIRYVQEGVLPDKDVLKARFKRSAFLYGEKTTEFSAEDTDRIEAMVYADISSILTGSGNNLGIIRGTARRIVNFAKEKGSFKKGEVLVTGMTDPNYVPLMKNAAAIVTDQGGLLSHAAIVSRELGIPCVIGTERATKVIKTGDMVEVDAEKGVVRIIEKI